MANGADIIIKGGSVELEFDDAVYPKEPSNPKKHKNQSKKVTRVVITGDIAFDSGDRPNGISCEIRASCK
jgi:hypothetical protein